ncbi:uncharacterized protein CLAFUR5_11784 [Fulvia fulva]|uniref:Uncharacterized protein n=1 Tax=Passalora fulva TaxID=5499 RepID=A0A9Q8UUR6_PASFU|nr:uncharacterized protein CLAFUR5_11784 [Fulvia fulva]KAK4627435.1 hypothetical protein CLAFUR0_05113 [Fulvia fulva]UJO23155.1 hypothetical protein CLAFUR5_11784 [Fulvia fulva]WPV28747.1 hypothetical protein CLAFUW7_05117 [Fulvia fulva]
MPTSTAPSRASRPPTRAISPGDRADLSGFMNETGTEILIAAYLGFQTTGELRKFILSSHFLQYFRLYDEGGVNSVHQKATLASIHGMQKSGKASVDLQDQRRAVDKLCLARPHCAPIPGIYKVSEIVIPGFSPAGADESDLEPYNRGLVLLKAAQYILSPSAVLRRFAKAAWEIGEPAQEFVPLWMRSDRQRAVAAPEEAPSTTRIHVPRSSQRSLPRTSKPSRNSQSARSDSAMYMMSDDEDDEEALPVKEEIEVPQVVEQEEVQKEPDAMDVDTNNQIPTAVATQARPETEKHVVDLVSDDEDNAQPQAPKAKSMKRERPSEMEVEDEDDQEEEEDLELELRKIEIQQRLRQLRKKRKAA